MNSLQECIKRALKHLRSYLVTPLMMRQSRRWLQTPVQAALQSTTVVENHLPNSKVKVLHPFERRRYSTVPRFLRQLPAMEPPVALVLIPPTLPAARVMNLWPWDWSATLHHQQINLILNAHKRDLASVLTIANLSFSCHFLSHGLHIFLQSYGMCSQCPWHGSTSIYLSCRCNHSDVILYFLPNLAMYIRLLIMHVLRWLLVIEIFM